MKKILIIGAGFLQSFVIKKAKQLGYYTITMDKNPHSIGFAYADHYAIIDIVDQEACLAYARTENINGVLTAATDYGVLSAAYIAQEMGLPGLDYKAAKIVKDKYNVRCLLSEQQTDGIKQYYQISDADTLKSMIDVIKYPVILKPCDGSGSKAVRKVEDAAALEAAFYEAKQVSLSGKVLIEDFISGREYGVESFVYDGKIHVLGVMGKHMTSSPDYAELGHHMPSRLQIEDKVKTVVENAIKALGINFGAVNMDVLVTDDQRVCIVDIGARMGGNLIGSHIIPLATGVDYTGNLVRASAGDPVNLSAVSDKHCISTRLLALTPGKVVGLPDFGEISRRCKVDIYHHLNIGDTIRVYHNNLDGCGYVVAVADQLTEAEVRSEKAKQLIDTAIIRA